MGCGLRVEDLMSSVENLVLRIEGLVCSVGLSVWRFVFEDSVLSVKYRVLWPGAGHRASHAMKTWSRRSGFRG